MRGGQHVKVIFLCDVCGFGAERMWVEVIDRRPDGRYIGKLRSEPFLIEGLHWDDVVAFDPDNVLEIADSPGEAATDVQ